MLTVAKVASRVAGGYADYLEGKTSPSALGDYYLKDGERVEAPGRWAGRSLGQEGAVSGRELRELMSVRDPRTGEPLRPAGGTGEAVAALDATFSAPKSVSAVWALADPELRHAIERAHERAIDQALGYAVEQVPMVRRRLDRETVAHERAGDVVATSWRHTTARAVDGQPPDPQLHSHVLLHAAVRTDGRLAAIDSRSWLVHRREVGAAYRTELAHEMARLGFEIQRGTGRAGRYFEINGVPQPLLDRWSSRHREVQAAIHARLAERGAGSLSPAEERLAAVASRASKQPATRADLDRHWHQQAAMIGFAHPLALLARSTRPLPEAATPAQLLSALTEFDATFTEREARAVALEQSAGAPIPDALATLAHARANHDVLPLADGRHTTAQHRHREHDVLARLQRLAHQPPVPIDPDAIKNSAQDIDRRLAADGAALSAEQRKALQLASGEHQVVMIEGQAGTGKSTVLQAVARAHQADGRQIIVTSTAALAAQRLAGELAQAGVHAPAYSTAALHHAARNGQLHLDRMTTIIHDEAALASTREQHQLLQLTETSGARLVLVGDPEQSQPIGAGGLWPQLEHELTQTGARVSLTHNLRARDPHDQRDQAHFRHGQHLQALRGYQQRDRIRIAPDQGHAEHEALLAAHTDRAGGRRTVVIAQTSNEHLDELNAHAQAIRIHHDELGTDSLPVPGRPYHLHAGDEIQIRRTIQHPEHGTLRNGTPATVASVQPERQTLELRLSDDTHVQLDHQQLQQADTRLAYVQHPFTAQGTTTDTTHLIISQHATREGTYVGLTRARHTSHIYVARDKLADDSDRQPLERLAAIVSTTEPNVPSIATPLSHEQNIEQQTIDFDAERPRVSSLWEQRKQQEPERQSDHDIGWEL